MRHPMVQAYSAMINDHATSVTAAEIEISEIRLTLSESCVAKLKENGN